MKYLIALEPGSSKIRGALGVLDDAGTLTVKAVEEERLTDAVSYGRVRNVGVVAGAMRNILNRLESAIPDQRITAAYVALGGRSTAVSTCSENRRFSADTEVSENDLIQLSREARARVLPDRDIIAVLPRRFSVDGEETSNPVGTYGRSFDVTFNLVSCRQQLKRSLSHVLESSLHLKVAGYIVRQLAEANLALSAREKRLGVMLVDFGAETTTITIYRGGVLVYLATLPLGSRNITRDIMTTHCLEEKAEQLKCHVGDATILQPGDTPFSPDGKDYAEVNTLVSARAGEIIANINEQIKQAGLTPEQLPGGIVIIGGGAKLRGFNNRLQQATTLEVRAGRLEASPRIRIGDSRINASDNLDIISILAAAANAQESKGCTEPIRQTTILDPEPMPEPEPAPANTPNTPVTTIGTVGQTRQPAQKPAQEAVETPEPQPEPESKHRPKKRSRNMFDRMMDRFTNLISEAEDTDPDLRDD